MTRLHGHSKVPLARAGGTGMVDGPDAGLGPTTSERPDGQVASQTLLPHVLTVLVARMTPEM